MLSLPIVARELQVASRRSSTYWFRAGGALAAIMIASLVMLGEFSSTSSRKSPVGIFLFWSIGGVALLAASLAGVTHTSDTISTERREGTLGLLFLTDLTGFDVASGKFASSSLSGIYALIAVQPILAMSLFFGGVTFAEYIRAFLVVLVTLGCSLSVGMLCSTCSASERVPSVLAFLGAIFVAGLGPAIGGLLGLGSQELGWSPERSTLYGRFFLSCSPITGFISCGDQAFQALPSRYWASIIYISSVGVVSLGLSSWRLPRIWQDKPQRVSIRQKVTSGGTRRAGLLEQDPIAWLALRNMGRNVVPWILVSTQVAAIIATLWSLGPSTGSSFDRMTPFSVFFGDLARFAQIILIFWVAADSGRRLLADRRSGGLELQLGTALTDLQIVYGHCRALWLAFRWPLAISLLVEPIPVLLGTPHISPYDTSIYALMIVGVQFLTSAAGWIALVLVSLEGAVSLSNGRIALRALALVFLLPWIVGLVATSVVGMVFVRSGFGGYTTLSAALPAVVYLGNAYFWARRARKRLSEKIRSCASMTAISASIAAVKAPCGKPPTPPSLPPPLPSGT